MNNIGGNENGGTAYNRKTRGGIRLCAVQVALERLRKVEYICFILDFM